MPQSFGSENEPAGFRRAEDARFRAMFEQAAVGLAEVSLQGGFLLVNDRLCEIAGHSRQELLQKTVAQITHPEDRAEDARHLQALLAGGSRTYSREKRYLHRGGAIVWVNVTVSLVRDESGEPGYFIGVAEDITDRKRMRELLDWGNQRLQESEHRFRLLFESGPNALIMIGADGRICLVNSQAEKTFGYRREELLGGLIEILVPARFRAGHEHSRHAFSAAPSARAMGAGRDLFGLRKDGSEVPIEIGLSPLITDHGRFTLATIIDITERKQTEAALRESEEQTRLLADAMPQIVWTARPDGYLDYYNRRWYDFTGFAENRGGDESWVPILHAADVQLCLDTWYTCVASGMPYEMEYRFWNRASKTWRWQLGRALPIRNEQGQVTKWVGTCTDIDDHKRLSEHLELRVKQRTQDLHRSLGEKETLLKEVHHRVKNNLQVICSLISLQIESCGPAISTAPLQSAYDRVHSMALIHERLYQAETLSDVDFGPYIELLTLQLFEAYCVDPVRIRLTLSVETIRLGIDQAVPCGLILNELISNSLKHAFPDGRRGFLSISFTHLPPDRVELRVADDGPGLPEDFDLNTVSSLGLQVVQTLARQLAGDVQISRQNGTQIALNWPLVPPE